MIPKKLHIGFLTSEFPTEINNCGGLGTYLNRIVSSLKTLGHEPEIFVYSLNTPRIVDYQGTRVERVPPVDDFVFRVTSGMVKKLGIGMLRLPLFCITLSLSLARALETRHNEEAFDMVQVPNNYGMGLFLKRKSKRILLTRLSSCRYLWYKTDGISERGDMIRAWVEDRAIHRTDIVYAPSYFLSEYYKKNNNLNVKVLRPPVLLDTEPSGNVPESIPARYMIHFGKIGSRKGSDILAAALQHVWFKAPDLKMVWAGPEIYEGDFDTCNRLWGKLSSNVTWLGQVQKESLYELVSRAEVSVLPSKVDNLPNTVIESLMLGTPVIGSKGASIDELIEPGLNGHLVTPGDAQELADIMLKVWNGELKCKKENMLVPAVFKDMEPTMAAQNLVRLAGFDEHGTG